MIHDTRYMTQSSSFHTALSATAYCLGNGAFSGGAPTAKSIKVLPIYKRSTKYPSSVYHGFFVILPPLIQSVEIISKSLDGFQQSNNPDSRSNCLIGKWLGQASFVQCRHRHKISLHIFKTATTTILLTVHGFRTLLRRQLDTFSNHSILTNTS